MSYYTSEITCPCCGRKSTQRLLAGTFTHGIPDLDLNRHNPEIYDAVFQCPHCGYVCEDTSTPVSEEIRTLVLSQEYQDAVADDELAPAIKKQMLHGALLEAAGQHRKAGFAYQRAYWLMRDSGSEDLSALHDAISCFADHLTENYDETCCMVLIDCLRQARRFDEAAATADYLLKYTRDADLIPLIRFEQKLIATQDSAVHSVSEVSV